MLAAEGWNWFELAVDLPSGNSHGCDVWPVAHTDHRWNRAPCAAAQNARLGELEVVMEAFEQWPRGRGLMSVFQLASHGI